MLFVNNLKCIPAVVLFVAVSIFEVMSWQPVVGSLNAIWLLCGLVVKR